MESEQQEETPGPEDGAAAYAAAARRHAAARDVERGRSAVVARLRLATFLPAAALLIWSLKPPFKPAVFAASIALFALFAVLVYMHARIEERADHHDARRQVADWGRARWTREWAALPPGDAPAGLDLSAHPYAADLDLFGRASLFQWLGPAATVSGRRRTADWLLAPAEPDVIAARQHAVAVLAAHDEWREELAAHGVLSGHAGEPALDRFLAWVAGAPLFGRQGLAVRAAILALTAAIWLLILLQAAGVVSASLWLVPVTVGVIASFATGGRVGALFDNAGGGERALAPYAALFAHAARAPREGAALAAIAAALASGSAPAPRAMRRLNALLGFANLRRGAAIFHFPIQALTLWDFHVAFALERWRRDAGPSVRGWLDALADLDALAVLARTARDTSGWSVPVPVAAPTIDGESVGHPLIPDRTRVANDVTIGPPGTLLLVTGSNMSGKSTLLRAVGLNLVLAQAGARVCARQFRFPAADLQTSIRVQDSLELGLSYFMAALARLKGVVDAAQHERPGRVLVYLLDEILQGTNSAERGIAVRAVARRLLDAGAIGAMTTHDLALAGEEPLATAARLVHFTETVSENGEMRFDYRLRPGLATSRNALRLMRLIGLDT